MRPPVPVQSLQAHRVALPSVWAPPSLQQGWVVGWSLLVHQTRPSPCADLSKLQLAEPGAVCKRWFRAQSPLFGHPLEEGGRWDSPFAPYKLLPNATATTPSCCSILLLPLPALENPNQPSCGHLLPSSAACCLYLLLQVCDIGGTWCGRGALGTGAGPAKCRVAGDSANPGHSDMPGIWKQGCARTTCCWQGQGMPVLCFPLA